MGLKHSEIYLSSLFIIFLKDFQPYSNIDAGAHHGQFGLSPDQEMWPELHVSARRPRTHSTLQESLFFYYYFYHFLPCSWCCMSRPLKRMTVGMVLAAIAFICAALVQLEIDVSRNVISYIQPPHCSAENISLSMFLVLFVPENLASLPDILRDSAEINEHEHEVCERFTAWK